MKLKSRVAVCHSIDAAGRGLKGGRPAWPDGARMTTHGTGMGHGGWLPIGCSATRQSSHRLVIASAKEVMWAL
jgi:hypothetical protein